MTKTKQNTSIFDNMSTGVVEFLKKHDMYSSKAKFRISRKLVNNQKKYETSLGSIYGGFLSMMANGLFAYLLIHGVVNLLEGRGGTIKTLTVENTYIPPDNEAHM